MLAINADNSPQTIIFEGDMTPAKTAALRQLAIHILFQHRRDATDSEILISTLVHEERHPDLIEFKSESVQIGSEKDAPPGTVRHLLRKILPYAPWKSNARVVIFQNAAGIKDEAETALLKTLEEPPPLHYFFLSVQTVEVLKETIRSRAVVSHFATPVNEHALPSEPWRRFYFLAGAHDFESDYPEAAEKIIAELRAALDTMSYSTADFVALEKLLYTLPRSLLEKETLNVQSRALKFALLPFLAAMRDRATQGIIPPLSPIVLSRIPIDKAVRAAHLMQHYLRQLDVRIFGNRPLNFHAVFYSFFFRFIETWQ